MNDAIYHRNIAIEEKYNLKLTAIEDSNVRGKAKSSILAGDSSFDLVMPMTSEAFAMTLEGLLCDISLIPYVSIESPWWHAGISNNTSIGGRNYFISGDLNLSMLNGVGVTFSTRSWLRNITSAIFIRRCATANGRSTAFPNTARASRRILTETRS